MRKILMAESKECNIARTLFLQVFSWDIYMEYIKQPSTIHIEFHTPSIRGAQILFGKLNVYTYLLDK